MIMLVQCLHAWLRHVIPRAQQVLSASEDGTLLVRLVTAQSLCSRNIFEPFTRHQPSVLPGDLCIAVRLLVVWWHCRFRQ
jgi:hypothetical protein